MAQGKYSDGRAIHVTAPAGGVVAGTLYRIDGWNGVAEVTAAAGATIALNIDPTYLFYVPSPAGFAGTIGLVGYVPPATAGSATSAITATSTANVPAVKVTKAKDGNGIMGVRVLNTF